MNPYGWKRGGVLRISFYMCAWGCQPSATFQLVAQTPVPVGDHPVAQVLADLDRDRDLDLAVAAYFGSDVAILENDGAGQLTARRIPVAGNPVALAAGDLDEDGWPDLAVAATSSGIVHILLGPDFRPGPELGLDNAGAVAIADLDRDGHLDVIGGRFEPGALRILAGDGGGGFALRETLDAPAGVSCIEVADLDADGVLDLAVTASTADRLAIYRGAAGPPTLLATGHWPTMVRGAALGGASPVLLVAANLGDRLDVVDAGDLTVREVPTGSGPYAAAAGDLDGDGRPEIAATNKFEDTLTVFGADLVPRLTLATGQGPTPIDLADLDGDGRLDLVVTDGFSNDVVLYLSR